MPDISYSIAELDDSDLHRPRVRIVARILAPDAKTGDERAAVVMKAAKDIAASAHANAVRVMLDLIKDTSLPPLALCVYAPDGKGFSDLLSPNCTWDVQVSDKEVSEALIKYDQLNAQTGSRFEKYGLNQDKAFNAYAAKQMRLSRSQMDSLMEDYFSTYEGLAKTRTYLKG